MTTPAKIPADLIPCSEAAELIGMTKQALRARVNRYDDPKAYVKTPLMFSRAEVLQWKEKPRQGGGWPRGKPRGPQTGERRVGRPRKAKPPEEGQEKPSE